MSKAESTYLLKDKVAIITGAGRGIGQATALKMAEESASVVLAARTSYLLEEVANDIVGLEERLCLLPRTFLLKTKLNPWLRKPSRPLAGSMFW